MKYYIITYDVADDKRRNALFKVLKDYAIPVQFSVFEAQLEDGQFIILKHKLSKIIKKDEDNVIFYLQCQHCKENILRLGKGTDPFGDGIFII